MVTRIRRFALQLLGLLLVTGMSTGCVNQIFDSPLTISTSARAAADVKLLGQVRVERCDYLVVIIPIIHDPRAIFGELLQEAAEKGGNAVVDFELRSTGGSFWIFPLFMRSCYEGVGEAALVES